MSSARTVKASRPLMPLTYLLKQIQGALRAATEEALAPIDITHAQASVLSVLSTASNLSNAELARASFVTPQSMVELLRSLESQGLLVRRPHPEGGRSMPAELTGAGREKLFQVFLAMRDVEERLLAGLPPEDRKRLRKSLEHCLAALRSAV